MKFIILLFMVFSCIGVSQAPEPSKTSEVGIAISCLLCRLVTGLIEELIKENRITELKELAEYLCDVSPEDTRETCIKIIDATVVGLEMLVKNGEELAPICYSAMWCGA